MPESSSKTNRTSIQEHADALLGAVRRMLVATLPEAFKNFPGPSVHSTISVGHCWSHPVPVKQLAKHWAMLPLAMPNALKFFVAYNDPQIGMVYEPKLIALNYFRRMVTLVA
eukprot:scaffold1292_cov17-Tisochrysis_lutea.AAC.1